MSVSLASPPPPPFRPERLQPALSPADPVPELRTDDLLRLQALLRQLPSLYPVAMGAAPAPASSSSSAEFIGSPSKRQVSRSQGTAGPCRGCGDSGTISGVGEPCIRVHDQVFTLKAMTKLLLIWVFLIAIHSKCCILESNTCNTRRDQKNMNLETLR